MKSVILHLDERSLDKLLILYNKVGEKGKCQRAEKSTIYHFRETLKSCELSRLTYLLESKNVIAPSMVFEKLNKEKKSIKRLLVSVFFDVQKAYAMLWKKGLQIKLDLLQITQDVFSWVMEFLTERTLLVGAELSRQYIDQYGTPQGGVVSPVLFSIVIYSHVFQVICSPGFSHHLMFTAAAPRFLPKCLALVC